MCGASLVWSHDFKSNSRCALYLLKSQAYDFRLNCTPLSSNYHYNLQGILCMHLRVQPLTENNFLPCFKASLLSSRDYCFVFLLSFSLLSAWWNTQMEVKMKCSWITLWTRRKLSGSELALPSTEWQKCLQSRTSSSSSSSLLLVPFVPRHLRFTQQWKKLSDKVTRFSWTFS